MKNRAIVLLSGGLDSITCLAIAKNENFSPLALSFNYGQRNTHEYECAKKICAHYDVQDHLYLELPLGIIGGSSLTTSAPIESNRHLEEIGSNIPSTYVPARNTLFLSYALAWADSLNIENIFIGVNAVDTSGYPDCRPEFIQSFEKMANLGTKSGIEGNESIKIHTPLQFMSKKEIIQKGTELNVPYELTNTCYNPNEKGIACGVCDACILRKQGFKEAGLQDPIPYQG